MPPQVDSKLHREEGTASVELVATVPILLLAVLVAAQLALVGQALWSAGVAARAGARAALIGADPVAAARRQLPEPMREGVKVDTGEGVSVHVRVPGLLPGLPELRVGAQTDLGSGDG